MKKHILYREMPSDLPVVFESIYGSVAHGTTLESSDIDTRIIYLSDQEGSFFIFDDTKDQKQAIEIELFLRRCSVGEPWEIEVLYSPSRCFRKPLPSELIEIRDNKSFLSKQLVRRYLFTAHRMMYRMEIRGLKWGYHALRILYDAERIISNQIPQVEVIDNRDLLMSIKRCEVEKQEIIERYNILRERVETLPTNLPEIPDVDAIARSLKSIRSSPHRFL